MIKKFSGVLGDGAQNQGIVQGGRVIGAGSETEQIPVSLLDKLKQQNNTGLGSASVQGNLLNTRASTMPVLDVANTYLTNSLTADELALILRNRS
ncbi:hypothetical protein EBP35_26395, partial [Salmonella enterica subsp. enterica serovar Antsalova]|nr:hypothetical protein [Salmonella enterica subsp. enterica serovar Antsalova]